MHPSLKRTLTPGAFCDIVTPFRNGTVDTNLLKGLVKRQIRYGMSGVVVCGQAGEATSLTRDERAVVIRCAIEAAGNAAAVIAGTGTNATSATIALTNDARQLGAIAAVIVMPYYNKPSQDGIVHHYAQVAAAVDLPIVICNAPGRTAIDLAPRTLERLAAIPSIVGIEDCTGDIGRLAVMNPNLRERLRFYSGHDATAFAFDLAGGSGAFSMAANIAPHLVSDMHRALQNRAVDSAMALAGRIAPLAQLLDREPAPAILKQALQILHGINPELRLPLTPVEPETAAAIGAAIAFLDHDVHRVSAV